MPIKLASRPAPRPFQAVSLIAAASRSCVELHRLPGPLASVTASRKMSAEATDRKGKSYLSSAVDSLNPWAVSRPSSPTPTRKSEDITGTGSSIQGDPGDHSITHLYGQSFRTYPSGCPPLKVQWFHAVDVRSQHRNIGSVIHNLTIFHTGAKKNYQAGQWKLKDPEQT